MAATTIRASIVQPTILPIFIPRSQTALKLMRAGPQQSTKARFFRRKLLKLKHYPRNRAAGGYSIFGMRLRPLPDSLLTVGVANLIIPEFEGLANFAKERK